MSGSPYSWGVRSGSLVTAGAFDGKLVLLNYSGNGQLGGIPGTQGNELGKCQTFPGLHK